MFRLPCVYHILRKNPAEHGPAPSTALAPSEPLPFPSQHLPQLLILTFQSVLAMVCLPVVLSAAPGPVASPEEGL